MRLARLTAALAVLVAASPATANKYEVPILIDDEEDLYELHAQGEIGDETLETLVELLQRGVDLDSASRAELYTLPNLSYVDVDAILAHRAAAGRIDDPADLVAAGVLDAAKLEGIAAFLVVGPARGAAWSTDGRLRAQTRWSAEDEGAPATALQARVSTLQHLTVGAVGTIVRTRLGDVRYDPGRDALSATAAEPRLAVPKVFALWETDRFRAIAGTYRIGFGQRLTFDNTRLYTPEGFVLDDQVLRTSTLIGGCRETDGELAMDPCGEIELNITPDFRWQDGLLGAAATATRLPLGRASLQATGFASYQPRDVYQYEIYDRGACDDPTRDDDPACAAPTVYRRQDDPLEPTSAYAYSTLPDMFAETTFGGNVAVALGRRHRLGVTGYGSSIDFLTEGIDLDFQEWSRFPRGGAFGAVGVDGATGIGPVDLFAEATASFDSVPDRGGGLGGVVRAVASPTRRDELEASLRWYGADFANPYARAIAAPDEVDGFRARDERGGRLRYAGTPERRLGVRASVDVWQTPSDERWNVTSYARGDVQVTDRWRWGLGLTHQDKDVGTGGRGQCFEVAVEEDEDGETVPCSGQRWRALARARWTPVKRYAVTAQYEHTLVDDALDDRYRQDGSVVLAASATPIPELGLRARTRYYDRDLGHGVRLGDFVTSYAEARYRLRPRDWLRLRYDLVYHRGDDVMGVDVRAPTEHWLWLGYDSRF